MMKHGTRESNTILYLLIACAPVFNVYQFGILNGGDIAIALVIVLVLLIDLKTGRRITISAYGMFAFFIVNLVISLIFSLFSNHFFTTDFCAKWIKIFMYLLAIEMGRKLVTNYKRAANIYITVVLICSWIIIIQYLGTFIGFHFFPYLNYPALNYNVNKAELISLQQRAIRLGSYRPAAIFPEPAHFAQFSLLGLALSSLFEKGKKRLMTRSIITIALVCCGSAIGIATAIVLWTLWYYKYIKNYLTVSRFIMIVILMVAGIMILQNLGILESVWNRVATTDPTAGNTTGNLRLLQGIAIFSRVPLINKILGLGFGNVRNFLISNNIATRYLNEVGNEYMNAFSTVLVSSGIVGFGIFIYSWIRMLIKAATPVQKHICIVLTLLFFTSSIFYSCIVVMYMIFIRATVSAEESLLED